MLRKPGGDREMVDTRIETLTLANNPKGIKQPLTAEACIAQGGQVFAAGKSRITATKNILKKEEVKQTN